MRNLLQLIVWGVAAAEALHGAHALWQRRDRLRRMDLANRAATVKRRVLGEPRDAHAEREGKDR